MMAAVRSCWALFLGTLLMMLGNGLQGSLLGIRASLEGFPTTLTGILMSGYYAGFLIGVRASAHHKSPGILRFLGSFGFCRAGSFGFAARSGSTRPATIRSGNSTLLPPMTLPRCEPASMPDAARCDRRVARRIPPAVAA
jgi:hypothetical protein